MPRGFTRGDRVTIISGRYAGQDGKRSQSHRSSESESASFGNSLGQHRSWPLSTHRKVYQNRLEKPEEKSATRLPAWPMCHWGPTVVHPEFGTPGSDSLA